MASFTVLLLQFFSLFLPVNQLLFLSPQHFNVFFALLLPYLPVLLVLLLDLLIVLYLVQNIRIILFIFLQRKLLHQLLTKLHVHIYPQLTILGIPGYRHLSPPLRAIGLL